MKPSGGFFPLQIEWVDFTPAAHPDLKAATTRVLCLRGCSFNLLSSCLCCFYLCVCVSVCVCVCQSHIYEERITKAYRLSFWHLTGLFFFFFSRPADGSMAASLHSSCQLRWFSAVSENTQLSHLRVPFIGLWSVHFFEFLFWALICLPILISSGGTSWDMLFCFQQRRTLLETRSPAQINW